jgi:neurotransmitter:Na+ symporter, NSS family
MKKENWGSRLGFILSTAGFAIGLGNIWRFPYIVGEHGGGAFILLYLLLAVFVGIPLLTAEVSLGRSSGHTPILGIKKMNRGGRLWNITGWLEVLAAVLTSGFYIMILSWILMYLLTFPTGAYTGQSVEMLRGRFDALSGDPFRVLGAAFVIGVLIFLVLFQGLKGGIELLSKIFMPVLFVIIIGLAVWALTLPGAMEGLRWFLVPDFSKLSATSLLDAVGQLFFSIGVGLAAGFVYGSYLKPGESDVPGSIVMVVIMDTFIAILAGLIIFPALFSAGMSPDEGPSLVFITMAHLFDTMPLGLVFGSIFFLSLFIAGFTSIVAVVEGIAASLMDYFDWSRSKGVKIALGITLLLAIPNTLAFSSWKEVIWLGKNFFEWMDFLSNTIFLPVGGLLICLFTAYVWTFDRFSEATNTGAGLIRVSGAWKPFLQYVIPLVILFILVRGLWG